MEPLTQEKLDEFFELLGNGLSQPVKLYLLGGCAMYLLGSSRHTVDLDYWIYPEFREIREFVNALANSLRIDIEEVPLDEFIPIPHGAEERHNLHSKHNLVDVYIFDPYSIAVSKIARGFEADFDDVVFLIDSEYIAFDKLELMVNEVLPNCQKYDIDPNEFAKYFEELRRRISK